MPKQRAFEDYDWKKINQYFQKTQSKDATLRRYRSLTEYFFNKAVEQELISLPENWDCVKYANAKNHPAKGVSCDIREFLVDPASEGFTYRHIAKQYGCSEVNIVYHANSLKLAHRRNKPPEHYDRDWKAVQKYLNKCCNLTKTARKFGISLGVIYKRFEQGILARPDGIGDPIYNPGNRKGIKRRRFAQKRTS